MSQYVSDITSLSSKGQVVLPISIRKGMNLQAGAKLIVISDGENILLKPIVEPDITEVRSMMDSAMEWASEIGLTENDIDDAIKTVRARKKAAT